MQKIKYFFVLLAIVLIVIGINTIVGLTRPKNSEIRMSSTTVIKELRALNRLETASFTIEKVIDAGTSGSTFQEFLYGDRILLVAHGEVIAGFDLSNLSDSDISVKEKEVRLVLPKPQILATTLDNAQTRVYDRKRGLLNSGNKDLESKARLSAQQTISEAACKGGIMDQASNNARKQLTALLKTLGFTAITIEIPQGSC